MSLFTQYPAKIQETTDCVRRIEKVTRSHMFRIEGYSVDKNIGKGNFLESTIFDVGGYDWSIQYYPNGSLGTEIDDISIFLYHKSKSEGTKAQVCFTILDQSGCALPLNKTTDIKHFKTFDDSWGYKSFCKRPELESKITDDCFVIESVITIFKVFPVEQPLHIVVPPGNIPQQLGSLLENGNGADVTFEVDGQLLSAHKCILAARSPVFSAQFFGPMKEKSDTIKIEEMEARVFKALLHFIYNDTFPEFEETS
ncbi:BTB/POZ and MATH domain-containing protein 2-like [Carex rostrata]